jgi:hypothetical protein
MKRVLGMIVVGGMMLSLAHRAMAQTKTVTGESKTVTATVEAIEASSRTLTLKQPDGTYVETVVPESVKRFSQIKVGDKITARYYENIVLCLKKPGEKDVDTAAKATTPAEGPAGTRAKQRTISATITAIDPSVPSITFTGPNGWKYSSRVQDKEALAKVKVGDKVDITWTEATLISVETTSSDQ